MYINEQLDLEDKLNNLCPQCYKEVTEEVHCTRCGKLISGEDECLEAGVDESFDIDRYEQLKNGNYVWGEDNSNDNESIEMEEEISVEDLPLFYEDDIPDDMPLDIEECEEECDVYTDIFELIDNIDDYENELNNNDDGGE